MNKKIVAVFVIVIFAIVVILRAYAPGKDKVEEQEPILDLQSNLEKIENFDIFKDYYAQADKKINELSLEERIGQIFLVRYPQKKATEELQRYKFGGYLLFERDFKNKTGEEIKQEIANLQSVSNIPLLIAVDEEGGKIVRASSNSNLVSERFKSPRELYVLGGFDKIREDTIEKSKFLHNLGINVNLAPVVDVSTNSNDYIYNRTLGEDTELTSVFAKTVIEASKGGNVSYVLKHFPGYGNNMDTHKSTSTDNKSYEDICNYDLPPFISGIKANAEAVLVSHNIVNSIDGNNPASLSKRIHEVLRNEIGFTGVVITDDLYMGAVSSDKEAVIKAILADNDLIIVTDYAKSIEDVKKAIADGKISEETINSHARRILAWKYYKDMIKN